MEKVESLSEQLYGIIMIYGPKLVGALITLVIGLWVISLLRGVLRKRFEKGDMEPSLRGFLNSVIGMLLKTMLWISVIGMMGVLL